MRIIALINQKGGVGKTTTTVNLAACLAELGKRVLVVDMDPQANASIAFGVNTREIEHTTYDLLMNKVKFADVVVRLKDNLHLIPSSIDLSGAEVELVGMIGRENVLRDALSGVSGYDFILMDCPPSLGLLNVNALSCAREVFIPLQCEFFALQGIGLLMNTIELVQKRINPSLIVGGVIACMFDNRKGLSAEVLGEIQKHFGGKLFQTKIRNNVRLAEAPSFGQSILDYAPTSYGAEDYRALAREVAGITLENQSAAASAKNVRPTVETAPETVVSVTETPATRPVRAVKQKIPAQSDSAALVVAAPAPLAPATVQPVPERPIMAEPAAKLAASVLKKNKDARADSKPVSAAVVPVEAPAEKKAKAAVVGSKSAPGVSAVTEPPTKSPFSKKIKTPNVAGAVKPAAEPVSAVAVAEKTETKPAEKNRISKNDAKTPEVQACAPETRILAGNLPSSKSTPVKPLAPAPTIVVSGELRRGRPKRK